MNKGAHYSRRGVFYEADSRPKLRYIEHVKPTSNGQVYSIANGIIRKEYKEKV